MKLVEVVIRGVSPLLMHNVRLANPLDRYTKQMGVLNREKKVKNADKEAIAAEMARVEWEGGLYHSETDRHNDGMGPYLPARNIHQAIHEGAKMTREGPAVREGAYAAAPKFRLEYEGPRTVAELWEAGFVDQRMVVVGQAKILRTRPIFEQWSATIRFAINPEVCDADRFIEFIRAAGAFKGVGDGHSGIMAMGRFEVVE